MALSEAEVLQHFPALANTTFRITSPFNAGYNCIAWAAEVDTQWWEPDPLLIYYWPPGVRRVYSLEAYVEAYSTIGYRSCAGGATEKGFEKIAIFTDAATGRPLHAARQTRDGKWTSKLGRDVDIMHGTADGLTGQNYGIISQYMKRPISKRRRRP